MYRFSTLITVMILLSSMVSSIQAADYLPPDDFIIDKVKQGETDRYYFWASRNQPYEITLKMFNGNADLYGDKDEAVSSRHYEHRSRNDGITIDSITIQTTSRTQYYIAVHGEARSTTYKISFKKAPREFDVTLDKDTVTQGELLKVDWRFSGQHHYFLYLTDTSERAINTRDFLSFPCQSIRDVDGSEGCIFQNTTNKTDSVWVVPSNVPAGRYKIKVVVWDSATGDAVGKGISRSFQVKAVKPKVWEVQLDQTRVEPGDTLRVRWRSEDQEEAYLLLRKGAQRTSSRGFIDNSCVMGNYKHWDGCLLGYENPRIRSTNWRVPADLAPGDYKIQLRVHNGVGGRDKIDSALSPVFRVLPPVSKIRDVTIRNLNTGQKGARIALNPGHRLKIEWDSENQHHAMLYLHNADHGRAVDSRAFSQCAKPRDGCLQVLDGKLAFTIWTVPKKFRAGNYFLRVAVWPSDQPGSVQAAEDSPEFTILGREPVVSNVRADKTGVMVGEPLTIAWNSENQHHALVYLYDQRQSRPVNTAAFLSTACRAAADHNPQVSRAEVAAQGCLGNAEGQRTFTWTPPAGLPLDQYTVKVVAWSDDPDVRPGDDFSPAFALQAREDGTVPPIDCQTGKYDNVADWAREAACYLAAHGILSVPADYDLRGDEEATRAEVATLIFRALLHLHDPNALTNSDDLDAILAAFLGYVPASPFVDVTDASTWFYLPVAVLSHLEYGDGISVFDRGADGANIRFLPNQPILRGWVLKALLEAWNIAPLNTPIDPRAVTTFPDIGGNDPAAPYIYAARQQGIANSGADGRFHNTQARRQDVFQWIYQLIQRGPPRGLGQASFGYTGDCAYLGARYEQVILYGVQAPSVSIRVVEPLAKPKREDGTYTMVLEAVGRGYDTRAFTDTDGTQLKASPFFAWRTNGGCLVEEQVTDPRFQRARWIAPDGFAPTSDAELAGYQIKVYLGDGLGSEVSARYTPEYLAPTPSKIKPDVGLADLPTLTAGRRVTLRGSAQDNPDTQGSNLGIREVRLWYEIDNRHTVIATNVAVDKKHQWKVNWWVPNAPGEVTIIAIARNLAGQTRTVRQPATIRPAYVIGGYVTDSQGRPLVNAKVRLNEGTSETIADDRGWFLFDHGVSSGAYSVRAEYDGTLSDKVKVRLSSRAPDASVALVVDREAPVMQVWASPNTASVGDSVTLQVAVNERLAKTPNMTLQPPGGGDQKITLVENVETGVWEASYAIPANASPGSATIQVTGLDRHGNTGEASSVLVIEPLSLEKLAIELASGVLVSGGKTELAVAYADAMNQDFRYQWQARCEGLPLPGRFDNPTSPAPAWIAPVNTSGQVQDCVLRAVMTAEDGSIQEREAYVAVETVKNTANKAWFSFAGDARDSSGYGHHAQTESVAYQAGRLENDDQAVVFQGAGRIRVADTPYFDRQRKFTISAWVKNQGGGMMVQQGDGLCAGQSEQAFYFGIMPENNQLGLLIHGEQGESQAVMGSKPVPRDDRWHFVVGVFAAGELRLYLDGEPDTTARANFAIMADSQSDIVIGNSADFCGDTLAYTQPFSGVMDDLGLHAYAMPYSEIRAKWLGWLVRNLGIPDASVTTLAADFKLRIPVMWYTETPGKAPIPMWGNLQLMPFNDRLVFKVLEYGVHATAPTQSVTDPALTIAEDGKWHIYVVGMRHQPQFGAEKFIWADLELISDQPVTLNMKEYGLN